jgi:hypothetical protein
MSEIPPASRCLNCGAALSGPFCSSCGQRAVPPNPTVAELTHDAWQELSGYDGRILATLRGLARPGQLTQDYVAGRRAHYLPPLRVYLTVSVLYFVLAAAAPATIDGAPVRTGGLRIELPEPVSGTMSEEDKAQLQAALADAPGILRPMLQSLLDDPVGFRARVFAILPRLSFAMLPVFAGIVSLFYRGRAFPTALVFAVHRYSFMFAVMSVVELMKFTGSAPAAVATALAAMALLAVYALAAFRRVYGGGWLTIAAKGIAIMLVYSVASLPALAVVVAWASLSK